MPTTRRGHAPLALLVLLAACAAALGDGVPAGRPAPPKKGESAVSPSWKEVDRLVGEQKLEEASRVVDALLAAAVKRQDGPEWTKALVRRTQLRLGLHGYETAVRELREAEWPHGTLPQATLQLFYAHALVTYQRAYSWEIGRREKVETKGAVDLKAWTREEIFTGARKAYAAVWKEREALGREPVERLSDFLDRNSYPKGIRDTVRDAVSYLFVELLADTAGWRPEQSNELFRLDLPALVAGDPRTSGALSLEDPAVHPLAKIGAVLDDLEAWHAAAGQKEAALEARLERARRLAASFKEEHDRALVRKDLEGRLPGTRDVPWWSNGMAELAELVLSEEAPGKRVRAHRLAAEGQAAYPRTVGGQRCLALARAIEAPEVQVRSMTADGPRRRSIEVTHRNLAELHFRAYPYDLESRVASRTDYNVLPDTNEIRALLAAGQPSASWKVALPATPDYELHRTFVTPALPARGPHVVVASARADFGESDNAVVGVSLIVTDLVLVTRPLDGDGLEVRVLSGATGEPVAGAEVALWRFDWQTHHQKVETKPTDASGTAVLGEALAGKAPGGSYFVLARKGSDVGYDPASVSFYRRTDPGEVTASFVYTDRSIYRPQQKLHWKVLAYRGRSEKASFAVYPEAPVTVSLVDPNGEKVETRTATTNAFGTASGEFTVPAGRLLGAWRVDSSLHGSAPVRVEEYKRPTFEASFKDPKKPLRLNRKAVLTGEVKYYFGLPVVNGSVRWRVTRETVYPWWWGWWGFTAPSGGVQAIGNGQSSLREDGTFDVSFTPAADERLGERKGISYRYVVSADVTDEGGETRSASRAFRVGFVSIEARVVQQKGFFTAGSPVELSVSRASLDGVPRPGQGSWRLVALAPPQEAPLPADVPRRQPPGAAQADAVTTPGDGLRPRWDTEVRLEALMASWPEGKEAARGEALHGESGSAPVPLGPLAAGAYRLKYETRDEAGALCEASQDFLVAGRESRFPVPALLLAESTSVKAGDTLRFLALSGLSDQPMTLDLFRGGALVKRTALVSGRGPTLFEVPVGPQDRGGFSYRLTVLRDHQLLQPSLSLYVPWDDKDLKVSFASFRDTMRPGGKETWKVSVGSASGAPVEAGAAELLAYMYDRSLDVFAPHHPPSPTSVYPWRAGVPWTRGTLGSASAMWVKGSFASLPSAPSLSPDRLKVVDGYGIGGPGARDGRRLMKSAARGAVAEAAPQMMAMAPPPAPAAAPPGEAKKAMADATTAPGGKPEANAVSPASAPEPPAEQPVALRSDFSETAFWRPHLLTGPDGTAALEFTVPDSVTSWNVWVHAVTRDLRGGSLHKEARSVKELMVRPYVPRFLREGDRAELKVVVNNASAAPMKGTLALEITDPGTGQGLLDAFGIPAERARVPFTVPAGGGTSVAFSLSTPPRLGPIAVKVTAVAGDLSDGELRPLPVLPSRMHLVQSRFVTLRDRDRKELRFPDMARTDDPSRIDEQLVVTVDAQLFYTVLNSLPYLVSYPYECTEQTLNRFVSTGIVSSVYDRYPAVAAMAKELGKRDTRLETWDAADPSRKMALEETPWLVESRGGKDAGSGLANVLDPRIAKADREASLAKLRKAQTSIGGFPWWPGGPPSPYMTVYILHGLARAVEHRVDVPKEMVQRAFSYVARHYRDDLRSMMAKDCCWELITFVGYVATCFPDPSWTGDFLTPAERREMLDFSFRHWRQHAPYLKGYLALTLKRAGREKDAQLVWGSVMDSARTNDEQGTFWAAEDRSWLWYNDTVETHAFALRTLMELSPSDPRKAGLVQWLLLNKKLNHWKSTRATAEVVYALVRYLESEKALGVREDATVTVGGQKTTFVFEPDRFTGSRNRVVVPGEKLDPRTMSTVVVEKESKGFAFASAAWHFSTEKLPAEERGDFFRVSRTYFRREHDGREWVLRPLADGAQLKVGDQLEVQLSLRSKHAAEYVHLRDPRGAGFEPERAVSRYRWDLGIGWYEETRDSGSNFFFEQLPAGEYTFKYRVRASMAGTFRVGPATVQSMYAPEFNAYSAGAVLSVSGE